MKQETLVRAKELEKDIQQMEFALSYYKRGRWSSWDVNDRASSFHFEFCKNWGHSSADMQDLPTWLNEPLMEVVERELGRCKHELETLGDEQEELVNHPKGDTADGPEKGLHASAIYSDELQIPKKRRPRPLSAFYALLLCLLFVSLLVVTDVIMHNLFGTPINICDITFSMAFTLSYAFFYQAIKRFEL